MGTRLDTKLSRTKKKLCRLLDLCRKMNRTFALVRTRAYVREFYDQDRSKMRKFPYPTQRQTTQTLTNSYANKCKNKNTRQHEGPPGLLTILLSKCAPVWDPTTRCLHTDRGEAETYKAAMVSATKYVTN